MVVDSLAVVGSVVRSAGIMVGVLAGVDIPTLFGAPGPVRAAIVILSVSVLGLGLCRWDASFLHRSVDASTAHPFSSLAYGLATHFTIAFGAVLLTAKLGRITLGGYYFGWLGVLFGVGLILATATFGFSVVGTIIVGIVSETNPKIGVGLGALTAGAITLLEPLLGVAVWLIVVSAGIGGFARRWFEADILTGS